VFNALDFGDLIPATIKVSFGFGLVGCFKGYYCKKRNCRLVAANSAVVYSMLLSLLLILSFFVTDIFYDL
jgi:phospholipid/cholesterol/gamma-HCH transport system permease protein